MKKYTLLFDFDGTLVDSMPYYSDTMRKVIAETGVSYPENIIEILTPLGYRDSARYITEILGASADREELIEKMHVYAKQGYENDIPLKEGVFDLLTSLKAMGFSLNVLTASPHEMLDVCLKRNGVFELFDNVWSCEDFGTTKSDPAIYAAAATRLGVGVSEIAFFDDNLHAVSTARSAGTLTFGVYDSSGAAFSEELRNVSHHFLPTLMGAETEILKILT